MRKFIAIFLGVSTLFLASCSPAKNNSSFEENSLASNSALDSASDLGHVHNFVKEIVEDAYKKADANCQHATQYYLSCECGGKGVETFDYGYPLECDFSAKVEEDKYLLSTGTCAKVATYFYSCVNCGQMGTDIFSSERYGEHNFSKENPNLKFLKTEATAESKEVYYKSCKCGAVGTETFEYGEPLRTYTEDEKHAYAPKSLTVSLYDAENSVYGFTYNVSQKPLRPVLQIAKGNNLNEYEQYYASVTEAVSYDANNQQFTYYIVKAEVELEFPYTYTYRVYDKYVGIGSETSTLQTKDVKATKFTFAHISDTQAYPAEFGKVLQNTAGSVDFLLHTGDVVESSKYEYEWDAMLHDNFAYLSKIPVMALSGNHETTYKNGSNEIFKHFNNKLPEQASTLKGYFYSYVYGNAKFIMLNTNDLSADKLTDEQYNWLVSELKNNECAWTIVGMHCPMYGVGQWGADTSKNQQSLALRSQLQGIFAQYGVDIVLQGHDHTVSRTYPINAIGEVQPESKENIEGVEYTVNPSGVFYLASGTSGGQTEKPVIVNSTNQHLYAYTGKSNKAMWTEFEIDGNVMKVIVKYTDGTNVSVYQTWGIKKSA